MKWLADMPVSRKLATILTITTTAALLNMTAAFVLYDRSNSQREAAEHLVTLGKIIAGNSNAAVTFYDATSANEVLKTLDHEPDIQCACTYDVSRNLLAHYQKQVVETCPKISIGDQKTAITSTGATYFQVILLNDSPVGFLYLESNLAGMKDRRRHFVTIALEYLLISLVVAIAVGLLLQRWITRPIVELASVIQGVTDSGDYSLRAAQKGTDEIGRLVAGFNLMLSEIKNGQEKLQNQALTDELTKLPNRRLFADRLRHALVAASRNQCIVALIYLDLDGFKLVNDTLGHSVGDKLLCEIAVRLRRRVRASDTFARIGGDEFTVVAEGLHNREGAELIARDLLAEFGTPFSVDGHELSLTASLGISTFPNDAADPEQLIRQADTAMYVAKATGKNKFATFSYEFGDAVQERMELETQLRRATDRQELRVHFQPEFEASAHRLVRFEALVRWQHPTLGMIPPLKFIPIAEETGLIVPIGHWVMEQACLEACKWQGMSEAAIQVAVNVSIVQLLREDFVDGVVDVLRRTGLNASLLQLELTESVLRPGYQAIARSISRLREIGVSMAIDDFGTGYSSLSYLQQMPFDFIKLDRSFVTQISQQGHSTATVESIVNLAHTLGMKVIVEGVESASELQLVEELGCDEIQGFLMGRPTADPIKVIHAKRNHSEPGCTVSAN